MLDEDYNFFLKNENINTDSDSISGFNENASTYMGVKTIQEGTVVDTDKKELNNKKNSKKNKSKSKFRKNQKNTKKKKKRKKSSSFSSDSESSYSFSSSSSYNPYIPINNLKKDENISNDDYNNDDVENINNNEFLEKKIESNEEKNETNNNINNNKIDTEFHWDEGGNDIKLTGSFCEWKEKYIMKKNEKGIYSIILPLTPGFYQYKFIVDEVWAYSKKQPKFEDNNGNVNNFIDTTDYNININNNNKTEKKTEKSPKNNKNNVKFKEGKEKEKEGEDKPKEIKRNTSITSINLNTTYSTYIPLKGEFNIKPSSVPGLYKTHYILNEKKNKKLSERKFSQIEYVDQSNNSIHAITHGKQNSKNTRYSLNKDSYVKFQNLYHIHSNHLHSKKYIDSKNTITSIITRYRAKFSTFIYYKDKKHKERSDKKHSKTVKLKEDLKRKIKKLVK